MSKEKIIIYLYAHSPLPSWAVVDAMGNITQTIQGDVHELARSADKKEVIVLVPAEDVILTTVQLPKMSRSRLMQAIPYALEEQLTDNVETLHFAVGEKTPEDILPIAIVAHEKMQQWLTLLAEWHIAADKMFPVMLALPLTENHWSVLLMDMAMIRTGLSTGFACDRHNFNEYLELLWETQAFLPEQIHIYNCTATPLLPDQTETVVKMQEQMSAPTTFLSYLTDSSSTLNLLQNKYANKKSRFPETVRLWKIAAYLALAWLALMFFYPTVSFFILHQRVSDIDAQIAQIYKHNFPQASSIIAPRLRMEEKLHAVNGAMTHNRFLFLVGYLGQAMSKVTTVQLKRLDFQDNQLSVSLTAANSNELNQFNDYLLREGLKVKQQNAMFVGLESMRRW